MLAYARDLEDGKVGLMEIDVHDVTNDLIAVYKEIIGVKDCRLVGQWWMTSVEGDTVHRAHKRFATQEERDNIAALVRVIKITETLEEE